MAHSAEALWGESWTLSIILLLHQYIPYVIFALSGIGLIWGLVLFFMKKGPAKPWMSLLWVAFGASALQGLLGVVMLLMGLKPGGGQGLYYLHYVYGAITIFAIPVALTYASGGKNARRDVLIYCIVALIMLAAAIRAFMTGPVA
ncbi:hypothetical protein KTH_31970 [Thermosporothrix hazakensis]|uniref:Histidine kinase N-terminal 7TM region domain-containing protein n=1 Tax=Thermosporothrix sp. COM3 TaxID=2490863 RepID=A0A455ST24_9CHLR|nr:hypothetical protein KTC_50420 [Thermosporothrix sp. COM3]GCE48328.1 hypothetical protein KTH_31970 [Thermosporothrix hazakensis]